jgi:predicted unusual protein kinase regulating ubiquinone biosynthesis (AarF/ABC1/UbiB family)
VRRPAQLLGLTTRAACEAGLLKLRGRYHGADAAEFHTRTAARYAQLLGNSKGMLMKAGQMLSFAPLNGLVAAEHLPLYQEALGRLCAEAQPMEPELTRAVLEHELGPLLAQFAHFDPEPFAVASIGQVHAAKLLDGRDVAVKIQYPEAASVIAGDLKNTELLATFVKLLGGGVSLRRSRSDFRGMAREIGRRVTEELDYRLEATTQAEFARRYRGHPFIHVPYVVRELCTGRVLCQELVHGLSWEQALAADQQLRDRWGEVIYRFVQGGGARFRVFHADPSPGNYLFHEDGRVSCLDFGCVKRFAHEQAAQRAIIAIPFFEGDALGTWQACVEVGLLREYDPVTPAEVFAQWRDYFEFYLSESAVTLTPDTAAAWMERCFSPHGPSGNARRHSTLQPTFILLSRIELGTISLLAQMRACIDWGSIGAEYMFNAAPLTEMGRLDHEFFGDVR